MDMLTGNKNKEISDSQVLKFLKSGLVLQFFLSLILLNDNINIIIFVIYNIYIWIAYILLKKLSSNILKYNVYLIYLVLNIIPIFIYLLLMFMVINNTTINILVLIIIITILYKIKKVEINDSINKKRTNKLSIVIIAGGSGSIIMEVTKDNILLEKIIILSGIIFFCSLIFYMFHLIKIYEEMKNK